MRRKRRTILLLIIACLGVVLINQSFWTSVPDTELKILSHRGVHQTFHREGLTNETCTAERIFEPTHSYIENTIPSIQAAFDYGADMVEFDLRRTADNDFAVFHDHKLDCRTNGSGAIRGHNMAELRLLDLGFGYTADGGATYPLRGKGVGLMVNLEELFETFPDKAFQINIKSNDPEEADLLFSYMRASNHQISEKTRLWSGLLFAKRWRELGTHIPIGSRQDANACAKSYILLGWSAYVPESCAHSGLVVPQNMSWLYWGWPRKTAKRFEGSQIPVFLTGRLDGPYQNIDTLEQVEDIAKDYRGWVITDRIEFIGPALKAQ